MTPEEVSKKITDTTIFMGVEYPTAINIKKLCEFLSTLTK